MKLIDKMKKVGIITIDDSTNYGNRLQNYAVQKILKKMGFEPITLLERNKKAIFKKITELFLFIKNENWEERKEIAKEILRNRIKKKKYAKITKEKKKIFKDFNNEFLNERILTAEDLKTITDEFDYFVVGSDQIWNPYFVEKESTRFLSFAPRHKRIALSPSITTSFIPEYKKKNL